MKANRSAVEPLEPRIAPALLVNGANLLGGNGNPLTAETSINSNVLTLVKVMSGSAIVWYDSSAHSITGISVGPDTKLEIWGDVQGDIVANLTNAGRLSDSDGNPANGEDGNLLLANNILGIVTHPLSNQEGSIGSIITGGTVSNLNISGLVGDLFAVTDSNNSTYPDSGGIYAGNGIFSSHSYNAYATVHNGNPTQAVDVELHSVDINPILPGLQSTFTLYQDIAVVKSGASVTNSLITQPNKMQIIAGDGLNSTGKAGSGGNVQNIQILQATTDDNSVPSYAIFGGNGGSGTTGGKGGSITKVTESKAGGLATLYGGDGGNGTTGAGGSGGSVTQLTLQSGSASYEIHGGQGGDGSRGGNGGSVLNNKLNSAGPGTSLLISGDFNDDGFDDVVAIDSGTSRMVLSLRNGSTSEFNWVYQDDNNSNTTDTPFIPGLGAAPTSAVAMDANGDGTIDIVVGYNGAGVIAYLNDGNGQFYKSKDTVNSKFLGGGSVQGLVKGNFSGNSLTDLAIVESTAGQMRFSVLEASTDTGTGSTIYNTTDAVTLYSKNSNSDPDIPLATSMVAASINGDGYLDAFIGLSDGTVISHATGVDTDPVDTGLALGGAVDILSVDSLSALLLAGSSKSNVLTLAYYSGGTVSTKSAPSIDLTGVESAITYASFLPGSFPKSIGVLVSGTTASEFLKFDYNSQNTDFEIAGQIDSDVKLSSFTVVDTLENLGIAAIPTTPSKFLFSPNYQGFASIELPFSGKAVKLMGGDGGDALGSGVGGTGGSVKNFQILGDTAILHAGDGGSSIEGKAGAGGSIGNDPAAVDVIPGQSTGGTDTTTTGGTDTTGGTTSDTGGTTTDTTTGGTTTPSITTPTYYVSVSNHASFTAGDGGSSSGTGAGGAGGTVSNLKLTVSEGGFDITTGTGGSSQSGAAGNGGLVKSVNANFTIDDVSIITGAGGSVAGGVGKAGSGGSLSKLTLTQKLSDEQEKVEGAIALSILTGDGGSASGGAAGSGGNIKGLTITVDPTAISLDPDLPNLPDTTEDTTVRFTVTTGSGGDGTVGGAGGNVSKLTYNVTQDQVFEQSIVIDPATASIQAGHGGAGSVKNGGAGGGISNAVFTGLSFEDQDSTSPSNLSALFLQAGNGGSGQTFGGTGGGLSGITSQNSKVADGTEVVATNMLSAASLFGGNGGGANTGTGGNGGVISNFSVAVQRASQAGALPFVGGSFEAIGGNGGTSTLGSGGNGGAVSNGVGGAVDFDLNTGIGLYFEGGDGATGAAKGGSGGNVSNMSVNTSVLNAGLSASFFGGNGGDATDSGAQAGDGGSIIGVKQKKDLNSSISIIQAGNGGSNKGGLAGNGGSVSEVDTVALIGRPSSDTDSLGVFNNGEPQGIFAGIAGAGADGINGSVFNVKARQISAIGAAMNPDLTFNAAFKVANIIADVIGYDVNGNSSFNDSLGGSASPSTVEPLDGFILATTVSGIDTANNARTNNFTFAA